MSHASNDSVLQVLASTDRRGAELFGVDLHQALVARGRAVRTVALATGKQRQGLDIEPLGPSRRHPLTIVRLRQLARAASVVVAHGSTTLPVSALALLGAATPFIYRNIGDPRHWTPGRVRRQRTKYLLGRAAAVAALTDESAEQLAVDFSVPRHRIRTIPTGVRLEQFPEVTPERRSAARSRLGLADRRKVVLWMGALSAEKNVGLAIRTVAPMEGVLLLIVGDGPERADAERLADRLAPGRVLLNGATSEPATALAAADALLLTSDTEGVPGVLIEAGLSGLPMVATDVGLVHAVVEDQRTGLLAPRGDAPALRGRLDHVLSPAGVELGRAARRRCAGRFDLRVVAAAWDDLIGEVTRSD
ncbi:MAG: glycosyltransferase [Pirellulales bacterium]|nr:glycosyltransferase [Pirellulales bacterium]